MSSDRIIALSYHLALLGIPRHAVASSLGVREQQVTRALRGEDDFTLDMVAAETGFVQSRISLTDARACLKICQDWSLAHGRELARLFEERGLSLEEAASVTGVAKATLFRWTLGKMRPRMQVMAPLLDALAISPSALASVEVEPHEGHGENLPAFTYALRQLRDDLEISDRELSRLLGVSRATLQPWMSGRSYPSGEVGDRLGLALSLTVEDSKGFEELANEKFEGSTKLNRLIFDVRREHAWTQKAFAERSGLSISTVRRLETAKSFEFYAPLRSAADTLGLDYDIVALAAFGPQPRSTFSENLKALRLERLLSVNELADLIGVAHFVYSRYETLQASGLSHLPASPGRLAALAAALSVKVGDLLPSDPRDFGFWLESMILSDKDARQAALLAGVDLATLQSWMEGRARPTFKQAKILARFFEADTLSVRALVSA